MNITVDTDEKVGLGSIECLAEGQINDTDHVSIMAVEVFRRNFYICLSDCTKIIKNCKPNI